MPNHADTLSQTKNVIKLLTERVAFVIKINEFQNLIILAVREPFYLNAIILPENQIKDNEA